MPKPKRARSVPDARQRQHLRHLTRFICNQAAYRHVTDDALGAYIDEERKEKEASRSTIARYKCEFDGLCFGKRPEWWPALARCLDVPVNVLGLLHYLDELPVLDDGRSANGEQPVKSFEQALSAWHYLASFGDRLFLGGDIMLKAIDILADVGLKNRSVVILGVDPVGWNPIHPDITSAYSERALDEGGANQKASVFYAKFLASAWSVLTRINGQRIDGLDFRWVVRKSREIIRHAESHNKERARSMFILANEHIALEQIPGEGPCTRFSFDVTYPSRSIEDGKKSTWSQDVDPVHTRLLQGRLREGIVRDAEELILECKNGEIISQVGIRARMEFARTMLAP